MILKSLNYSEKLGCLFERIMGIADEIRTRTDLYIYVKLSLAHTKVTLEKQDKLGNGKTDDVMLYSIQGHTSFTKSERMTYSFNGHKALTFIAQVGNPVSVATTCSAVIISGTNYARVMENVDLWYFRDRALNQLSTSVIAQAPVGSVEVEG